MLDKTKQDWKSQAADLEIEGRAFINGRYQEALAGETRATMAPSGATISIRRTGLPPRYELERWVSITILAETSLYRSADSSKAETDVTSQCMHSMTTPN